MCFLSKRSARRRKMHIARDTFYIIKEFLKIAPHRAAVAVDREANLPRRPKKNSAVAATARVSVLLLLLLLPWWFPPSLSFFFLSVWSCFAGKRIPQKERKKERLKEKKKRDKREREIWTTAKTRANASRPAPEQTDTHRERRVHIILSLSLSLVNFESWERERKENYARTHSIFSIF